MLKVYKQIQLDSNKNNDKEIDEKWGLNKAIQVSRF